MYKKIIIFILASTLTARILSVVDAKVYKFDGHVHSHVEPEAPVTIQQTIDWHKQFNINSMALTNHDPGFGPESDVNTIALSYLPLSEMACDLEYPVLPGTEWSSRSQHILIYWNPATYTTTREKILYNETCKAWFWSSGLCRTAEEYIALSTLVHELGGILGVAHYSLLIAENIKRGAEGCAPLSLDIYYKQGGYDFIEVVNVVPDFEAYNYAKANKITMISGTDVHTLQEGYVPLAYTTITIDDAITVPNAIVQAIWEQIKLGNTQVSYNWESITPKNWWKYLLSAIGGVALAILATICGKKARTSYKKSEVAKNGKRVSIPEASPL